MGPEGTRWVGGAQGRVSVVGSVEDTYQRAQASAEGLLSDPGHQTTFMDFKKRNRTVIFLLWTDP